MTRQAEIQSELEKAEAARARGTEGQARVLARRAAGIAARDYLARHGRHALTSSAYDLLTLIAEDDRLPTTARGSAAHLILQVNEEFKLPPGIDLIAEARRLCATLSSDA